MRYVERFATTEAKLVAYLKGKLRERGWAGEGDAPIAETAARLVDLGYVNDRIYAESKARGLQARGFGARRVGQALTAAGVDRDLRAEVGEGVDADEAAMTYARRKRIGPYGPKIEDRALRQKQFAAMMRAGHPFETAKRLLGMSSDELEDAP